MAAYDNAEMPRAPTQYGPPLANFGAQIASLPDSYYQGAQQRREYDQARAFQNGVPMKDGKPDTNAMTETVLKFGGTQAAAGLIPTLINQDLARGAGDDFKDPGTPQQQPQPQQPRPTAPVFAPGPKQQPQRPPVATADQGNNGGDTVRSVMTETFGDRDVSASIPSFAQSLGVQPDAPLSPQQVAQLKQRLAPGQERMQPAQPQAPQPQPQTAMPAGMPAGYDEKTANLYERRALEIRKRAAQQAIVRNPELSKAYESQAASWDAKAKQIYDALAKNAERTGPQKESLDPNIAPHAGEVEIEKKYGEAQGKAIGEAVDASRSAQKRIQNLAVMKDALTRGGGDITTGPFAETVLKAKQIIGDAFGFDVSGKTEAEIANKIGFQLASQAVKEISARPTQFEFAQALRNLPGLQLSPTGSKFMIDVLGQSARHDIELAKLAQKRENRANWPEVEDKFYQSHPIMSPFDRKVPLSEKDLSVLSAGAPKTAVPQQNNATNSGLPMIESADGRKMTLSPDGKSWVPMK